MIKPRKKRKNKYQESAFSRLKGNFRTFHSFFFVFALFCFVIILGAGLSRLYRKLIDAPWLKLERVEITGLKKLDRFEILNASGLRRGQCTLSINTEEVAGRLKELLLVKDVSVKLNLGGSMSMAVVERKPAAIVKCGERNLEMDPEGILFCEAPPSDRESLPVITGLCDAGLTMGDRIGGSSFEYIKELLSAIDDSKNWLSGTAINECRWTETGFTLILGERAVPVEIGRYDFTQKLTKLKRVINTLNEQGWTDIVTRIDLDYPGQAYLEGPFLAPRPAHGPAKQPG